MVWTDNAKGISEDIKAINKPDLGSALNPFGGIYADFIASIPELPFNAYLNAIGSTGQSLDLIKGDLTDNTLINTPIGKVGKFAVNDVVIGTYDANSLDFPGYNLSDGADKNLTIATYAAGTAYALTGTSAALDFGTTDPATTLTNAGTWLLSGRVNLKYNGATFAAPQAVTLKLRRTNNTAADIANSSTVATAAIVTTVTATFATIALPPVVYTTIATDDIITIFGDVAVVPGAGSLDAIEASIVAVRLF